jgi:hypothetical protein
VTDRARVRLCPDVCARIYTSCVSTEARAIFASDDAAFCASQLDSNSPFELELDANDCLQIDGPSTCEGDSPDVVRGAERANEADGASGLSAGQVMLLVTLGVIVVGGVVATLAICTRRPETLEAGEYDPYHPFYRQPLFVPGDGEVAQEAARLG